MFNERDNPTGDAGIKDKRELNNRQVRQRSMNPESGDMRTSQINIRT